MLAYGSRVIEVSKDFYLQIIDNTGNALDLVANGARYILG